MGALCLILGGLFLSHSAYAASYLNVSSSGAVSFGSIRPTSSGTSSTGSDTLTVHTDCSVGYSVYVSGQNGKDTSLTNNSASSNNTISTSSNAIGSAGSLNANTWGLNYENTGAYVGLPTYADATNVALTTKTSVAEESTVPIYYGIKVDTSITPGTYTGDVLYTVLMNSSCQAYTIVFNANGGSGEMSNQSIMVGAATNLSINTYTRSGYAFLGWAESSSATTATYTDGQSVTDLASGGETKTLYAVWGKSTGNMQDFQCTSLASDATTYLTDVRDNQVYRVYRIPTDQAYRDSATIANIAGKCLMTTDLSLGYVTGGSITKGSDLILSTDTSVGATTTNAPIYARTGTNDWSDANNDMNLQYINGPNFGYEAYSSHSYYSWGAAQKVCPRGWRLPTIAEYAVNSSASAPTMGLSAIVGNDMDGSSALRSFPYGFVLGGDFSPSGWSSQSYSGIYWTSSQFTSSVLGYNFLFSMRNVYRNYNNEYLGRSVRCIAQDNYTITYTSDGAESGEASKASEVAYENGSVTMPTVGTMTKSGYEFKGWALTSGASSATYTAGQTVTLSALLTAASSASQTTTSGSTITLYPVWKQVTYMQSWTGCSTLSTNEIVTLTDSRDGNEYAVKKLADGKCWMVQNLRLVDYKLTSADSDVLTDFTLTASTGTPSTSTWCTTDSSACNDKSLVYYNSSETSNGSKSSYYGALYNWYAATAGTGTYSTGTDVTASSSICPKEWHLPKGGTDKTANEFSVLDIAWGGTGVNRVKANTYSTFTSSYPSGGNGGFELAGYIYGSVGNVNAGGGYWSSTAYGSNHAYYLALFSSNTDVYPQSNYNKYGGLSVRCVKEGRTISDITYMQDINSDITANTTTNTYAQLTDSRDGNKYYVKKLADGKLWMVQNLRLVGSRKLTSADSDVSSDFTLTASAGNSGWCTNDDSTCGDKSMVYYDSSKASTSSDASYYGALYNWYAATAGTGTYSTGSHVTVSSSICPKGWRLPKGVTSEAANEFSALDVAWGGTGASRTSANTYSTFTRTYSIGNNGGFGLAGIVNYSVNSAGSFGFYWSSTASSINNAAYSLVLSPGNTSVDPQNSRGYRYYGYSVRCVAK